MLQPTIKEIQLQNEAGNWITIWSDPQGKSLKLTPDGAEMVLDTVSLNPGTYVGTRLKVSSIYREVDVNHDGDTADKNVEIVLTLAEFQSLPPKSPPSAPSAPSQPITPTPPSPPTQPSPPANQGTPSGNVMPPQPTQPAPPYTIKDGLVCTGDYIDEQATVIPSTDYLVPLWSSNFVYDGSATKLVYDFTLNFLGIKEKQVSITASTEKP